MSLLRSKAYDNFTIKASVKIKLFMSEKSGIVGEKFFILKNLLLLMNEARHIVLFFSLIVKVAIIVSKKTWIITDKG